MFRPNGNGNGNGHGAATGVVDEEATLNETRALHHDDEGPSVEPDRAATVEDKPKRSFKKPLLALLFILVVGAVMFLFMIGAFSNKRAANVRVAAPPPPTRNQAENSADTDKAIDLFAQSLDAVPAPTAAAAPAVQATPAAQAGAQPNIFTPGTAYDPSMPVTSMPIPGVTVPNNVAGTVQGAPTPATAQGQTAQAQNGARAAQTAQTSSPSGVSSSPIESEPAQQRSRYTFRAAPAAAQPAAQSASPAAQGGRREWWPQQWVGGGDGASTTAQPSAPVVPPFGAELPVRTLGALYSLRSDTYVKLELLRAVKGDGWSLPRGTKFIGRVSGAENDRAFVKVMGFIDPASRKLMLVGGEVRGVDGGDGLKGSRKRVGKLLGRVLQEAYRSGVQLTSAWLSGRSGGSQIYLPTSAEVPGLGGQNAARMTEYVKVKAGTLGSVMITDLPGTVRGAQPASALDDDGATMGEDELIELLSTGTPEEIRAAFPRMSPQLRQLAEVALRDGQ